MKQLSLIVAGFLLLITSINAQQGLSPLGMRNAWPLMAWSPAQSIDSGLVIGLPSVYFNGYHSGPNIWRGLERDDNHKPYIDLDKWIDRLDDRNTILADIEIYTLSVSYRKNEHQFGLHHASRTFASASYPKQLAEVIAGGNAQFIDQTINIGPSGRALSFQEIGFSYGYHQPTWSVGVRAKWLHGLQHVETMEDRISLYTNPEIYQLTLDVDYRIRQAGILTIEDGDVFLFEPTTPLHKFAFTRNNGWAFDLGASWRFADKWTASTSLMDLGSILWNTNSVEYHSEGSFTYEGVDIRDVLGVDSFRFEEPLDSLRERLGFEESPVTYRTRLPMRWLTTLHYDINDKNRLTLIGAYRANEKRTDDVAIAVQWNTQPLDWLSLGLQYAIQNDQYDHWGVNAAFDLRWVQFYLWTDNAFHIFRKDRVHVNGGAGLLLTFH